MLYTSCSSWLYSPSVFSLMTMMSMSLWRAGTPGSDRQCTRLANNSNSDLWNINNNHKLHIKLLITLKYASHVLLSNYGDLVTSTLD